MTTDDGTSSANQKTSYKQHCLGLWEVKICTVVPPVYWVVKKVSLFLSHPQALHMTGEKVTWQQTPASWPFFASSVSSSPSCWWLWPWNVSDHRGPTSRGSKNCRWWVRKKRRTWCFNRLEPHFILSNSNVIKSLPKSVHYLVGWEWKRLFILFSATRAWLAFGCRLVLFPKFQILADTTRTSKTLEHIQIRPEHMNLEKRLQVTDKLNVINQEAHKVMT